MIETLFSVLMIILGLAMALPFYRVLKGPSVYDRMMGLSVIGTKTVVLICFAGMFFEHRLDQFIDIAVAYAMLNFIGALAVAKYLDRSEQPEAVGGAV